MGHKTSKPEKPQYLCNVEFISRHLNCINLKKRLSPDCSIKLFILMNCCKDAHGEES